MFFSSTIVAFLNKKERDDHESLFQGSSPVHAETGAIKACDDLAPTPNPLPNSLALYTAETCDGWLLFQAAEDGRAAEIQCALDDDSKNPAVKKYLRSALMQAVAFDQLEAVMILLNSPKSRSIPEGYWLNAFIFSAARKNQEMMHFIKTCERVSHLSHPSIQGFFARMREYEEDEILTKIKDQSRHPIKKAFTGIKADMHCRRMLEEHSFNAAFLQDYHILDVCSIDQQLFFRMFAAKIGKWRAKRRLLISRDH